ncbi:MAG: GntR family transcriptional regulator [Anaerolineales bacterium]|nr:GntR family transcriptional regulator [Anaerolineales bacterium]
MLETLSKVDQVTANLRALIDGRQFEAGRLPSEPELASMLGASRATIRQALAQLAIDGLIVRKHGVGTFVNQHIQSIQTRLEEVWDFAEMIRLSGHSPAIQHIEMNLGPASPEVARKLALEPETELLTTANIFLADGLPVIYCLDFIPAHLVKQAYRDEELHGPVYTFLEKRCGQRVDHNITEILPVVADHRLSELLDCPAGTPLHYFAEVGFNNHNIPILYSEEYYRPEFFSFTVIRKMTSRK